MKNSYDEKRRTEGVMKTTLRGIVDIICFVVGPFFATYYLFDFGHGPAGPGPFYYYYRHNSKLGLALGVTLICLGVIIRYWRKHRPSESRPRLQERMAETAPD